MYRITDKAYLKYGLDTRFIGDSMKKRNNIKEHSKSIPLKTENIDKRIKAKEFQFGFCLGAVGLHMTSRGPFINVRGKVFFRAHFYFPAIVNKSITHDRDLKQP